FSIQFVRPRWLVIVNRQHTFFYLFHTLRNLKLQCLSFKVWSDILGCVVSAFVDVRRERRLFSLLSGLSLFGVGHLFTRKSWLTEHPEAPSYWPVTKVKLDYTAEVTWGVLTYKGNWESETKEMDKAPIRYVSYPPLLRAMLLVQRQKDVLGAAAEEPTLPLKRDVQLSKEYFKSEERERQEGTAV
uniref:Uncharacterized protein n=1 Tax=Hucho hucho TaxID=62062 RepID=A0A4W5K5W6_9TELE